MEEKTARPYANLKTNRKLGEFFWLNLITFGIYGLVFYTALSNNLNTICSPHDGKKTMHYCLLAFLVGNITFGIGYLVWFTRMSKRLGAELKRRGIDYSFGASTYWLWNILGSWILAGPFVYIHKLCKAMNLLCKDYNING